MIVTLVLFVAGLYVYYEYFWQEWSPARIERITGVRVPDYTITGFSHGNHAIPNDFNDRFYIEFKAMPSDEMFDEIDEMIATGKTAWEKDGDKYFFSVTWGNGLPAPKGERKDGEGMFSIAITRGEINGKIVAGD